MALGAGFGYRSPPLQLTFAEPVMPAARRPRLDDRRRLVIYSQRYSADAPAQSQRARAVDAALRGARKPAATYGWRVQRRLRTRLFGIVPVRRRALLAVVAAVFGIAALLALGHWASLWWPPVALRPALARPLRLDRPDSFGTWLGAVMMVAAAGGSFMVYQLRRYRADDYRGHYRMWRIAIVLCLLASLDAVVHLASWLGAAIDVVLAERDVLAGADWVRLLLTVGGAAFGLRITVELARCRMAAATMVLALALLGVSSVTRWNFLRIEEATAVTWLPISLVAGRGAFLVAVVIYLRMLYREVRKLESSEPLSRRLRKLVPWRRLKLRQRRRGAEGEAWESESPAAETTPRRSLKRSSKRAAAEPKEAATDAAEKQTKRWLRFSFGRRKAADSDAVASDAGREEDDAELAEHEEESPRRKRFGLPFRRRAKFAGDEAASADETIDEDERGDEAPRRKRFGLSLRRRAKSTEEEAASADDATDSSDQDSNEQGDGAPRRKRFGLPFRRRTTAAEDAGGEADGEPVVAKEKKWSRFSLLRRRAASENEAEEDAQLSGVREHAAGPQRPKDSLRASERPASHKHASDSEHDDDDADDSDLDPEGVDWESLNKSERRRARKLLKRQGKAA